MRVLQAVAKKWFYPERSITTVPTQNKNIAEVKEATLVTAGNAQDVLNRVYDYYAGNETISFKAAIEDQELGNCVRVSTGFKGVMTGNITKLDFKFSRRKITAEVTVK